MVMLNVEPLATPSKDAHGKMNIKTTTTKKEAAQDVNLEDVQIRGFDESSSSKPMKSKKIAKKGQQSEYVTFFKYHFDKLAREHHRWTPAQISSVVRLLWQKKKRTNSLSLKKTRSNRMTRPITGRKFFLNKKKMESGDAAVDNMKKWKRLPKETKMMYSMNANPALEPKMDRTMTRASMVFPTVGECKTLNFLTSRMM